MSTIRRNAIIVDLDGTIADTRHRLHHLDREPKDWDAFHAGREHDLPVPYIIDLMHRMHASNVRVIIVTCTPDTYRMEAADWLQRHSAVHHRLFMRMRDDKRDNVVVKSEIYRMEIAPLYNVLFAIEDQPEVVQMWHMLEVPCFAVNPQPWVEQIRKQAWRAGVAEARDALIRHYKSLGMAADEAMAVRIVEEVRTDSDSWYGAS